VDFLRVGRLRAPLDRFMRSGVRIESSDALWQQMRNQWSEVLLLLPLLVALEAVLPADNGHRLAANLPATCLTP